MPPPLENLNLLNLHSEIINKIKVLRTLPRFPSENKIITDPPPPPPPPPFGKEMLDHEQITQYLCVYMEQ